MIRLLVLAACGFLLSACGAAQQYYRLNADGPAPVGTAGLSVGVGPVTLPGYVDRAELVFQSDANQFQVPSNVHWAGTLQENIIRVLATDLGRRLPSANVRTYPWTANAAPRLAVVVEVRQFHAVSGGSAILDAAWGITDARNGGGAAPARRHNVSLREPVVGDGYGSVVVAESRLLARLADEIAPALRRGR